MRRRRYLATGMATASAAVAGCGGAPTGSETTPAATDDPPGTATAVDEDDRPIEQSPEGDLAPATSVRFGETYAERGVDVTVLAPAFETSVATDEGVHALAEGRALALVPVAVHNGSDERQGLLAPSFHLVHDDATVEERNRIEVAGGSMEALDRTDVYGVVDRNDRWRAHGTSLDVDETYSTTAIFEISTEADTEQVSVVFEPTSGLEDHFADDAIRWD